MYKNLFMFLLFFNTECYSIGLIHLTFFHTYQRSTFACEILTIVFIISTHLRQPFYITQDTYEITKSLG